MMRIYANQFKIAEEKVKFSKIKKIYINYYKPTVSFGLKRRMGRNLNKNNFNKSKRTNSLKI